MCIYIHLGYTFVSPYLYVYIYIYIYIYPTSHLLSRYNLQPSIDECVFADTEAAAPRAVSWLGRLVAMAWDQQRRSASSWTSRSVGHQQRAAGSSGAEQVLDVLGSVPLFACPQLHPNYYYCHPPGSPPRASAGPVAESNRTVTVTDRSSQPSISVKRAAPLHTHKCIHTYVHIHPTYVASASWQASAPLPSGMRYYFSRDDLEHDMRQSFGTDIERKTVRALHIHASANSSRMPSS
jgi:hypothetical protein